MYPIRVYLMVAAAIAGAAFAIGQLYPGMGVPFAALTTTLWAAYAVVRQRRNSQVQCGSLDAQPPL